MARLVARREGGGHLGNHSWNEAWPAVGPWSFRVTSPQRCECVMPFLPFLAIQSGTDLLFIRTEANTEAPRGAILRVVKSLLCLAALELKTRSSREQTPKGEKPRTCVMCNSSRSAFVSTSSMLSEEKWMLVTKVSALKKAFGNE